MATPVTDLPEEQADAITGGFEALSSQITELSAQVRSLVVGQRIQLALLLLVAAAVIAPYIAAWADLSG